VTRRNLLELFEKLGLVRDGKPVFRVLMLLTCPYRYVYDQHYTRAMAAGSTVHEVVQRAYVSLGYRFEELVSIDFGDFIIEGHIDLFREVSPTHAEIIEIKHASPHPGRPELLPVELRPYAAKSEVVRYLPAVYYAQVVSYAAILKYLGYLRVDARIMLLPEAPDSLRPEDIAARSIEIRVKLPKNTSVALGALLRRAKQLHSALKRGFLTHWINEFCDLCPFRDRCRRYQSFVRGRGSVC